MNSSYGHVQPDQVGANGGRNKKLATIGISSLILVAMCVAVAVGVSNHNGGAKTQDSNAGGGNVQTSSKAVEALCNPTDYKDACKESLKDAGNTNDPKELIQVAFNATIQHINDAISQSSTFKELAKDPMASQALENCRELMNYAVDDLKHSFERLGNFDVSKIDDLLNDLSIWLSAAVTYQETCLDGFDNVSTAAGDQMRKALNMSMALTSNALAMSTQISSILTSLDIPLLHRRRLLNEDSDLPELNQDGSPTWVSNARRGLLAATPATVNPDAIVAQDGTGKFKTIKEALAVVPPKNPKTFVIYIKAGVYNEEVIVDKTMTHVMFLGDGPTQTKITGSKNFVDGTPTLKTATVQVLGDNFMAKDIGFENTAGAEKHQAVALRVQSDMSIFYNCQIDAYQDTLYTHTKRQFYRDCTISGTIDFIFGDAAVVLQNCKMIVRKPMDNQQNIVTAQGRKDKHEATGIILQDCTISADPELVPFKTTLKSYLGRPWKEFSRTIIMHTTIDDFIAPQGWLPWMGSFGLDTCFYAEINNKGPGAALDGRVKWKGVRTIDPSHATAYTANRFIQGDSWIPATGVPYTSGLSA